jgi:ABC-type glycerol-3-phosphate transport system permease component
MILRKQQSTTRITKTVFLYILLTFGALISLFPFYWMVSSSLKISSEISQFPPALLPKQWSLEHYLFVFEQVNMARVFLNSLIVSVGTIVLNLLVSALVAYALTKLKFPGKNTLYLIVIALMMMPFQLLMIPLFLLTDQYGLMDTYWAVILPAAASSFSIFLLRQAFLSIPNDYIEAARIDGSNHVRILFTIVAAMAKPMILTVLLINFYWTWNDFLWPSLVLTSEDMVTLPVSLAKFQGFQNVRWGAIMAASTLTAIPIIVLYMLVQRKFIESLAMSGLK